MLCPATGLCRIETHFSQSDKGQWPDITFLKTVDPDGIQNRLFDFLRGAGRRKTEDLTRIEQPADVFIQTKDRRAAIRQRVAADPLKIPGPIVEGMRQNMNLGLFPRNHLSV